MKRFFFTVIFVCALLCPVTGAYGQDYVPAPVTISKDKVKVDGKLYYSHIVLEKQTLYSICKAYGVTVEDVNKANPTLAETGLKKNAIILIPIPEAPKKSEIADEKPVEQPLLAPAENPTKETAREKKKALREQKKKDKEKEEKFITHTVKWYEDLDVISEKYNVPVQAIMEANNLTGRKLSNRQKLKIPTGYSEKETEKTEETVQAGKPEATDSLAGKEDKSINENALFKVRRKNKVDAVILLPFNASMTPANEGYLDFYYGALLAVKQLGDMGINIDLSVYDTAGGVLPITTERLQRSDFAIGPVASADLERLLEKCPAGTSVISPLDHRAEYLANTHTNFFQVPTSTSSQYEDLLRWIKEDSKNGEPVIVIYEKGVRDTEETTSFNNILAASGIPHTTFSYSILEGRNVTPALDGMMKEGMKNRVLIVSESEAFVNDVVRNLNVMIHNKKDVVLYAPSKIRSFETIEIDNLHNTNLHTSLSYYIDYECPEVKDFLMQYRALFNTEPSPFAFQGYDICRYFVKMYSEYGPEWYLTAEKKAMLQSDFLFKKTGENGGYVNTAIRRVVYGPDYSVRLTDCEE